MSDILYSENTSKNSSEKNIEQLSDVAVEPESSKDTAVGVQQKPNDVGLRDEGYLPIGEITSKLAMIKRFSLVINTFPQFTNNLRAQNFLRWVAHQDLSERSIQTIIDVYNKEFMTMEEVIKGCRMDFSKAGFITIKDREGMVCKERAIPKPCFAIVKPQPMQTMIIGQPALQIAQLEAKVDKLTTMLEERFNVRQFNDTGDLIYPFHFTKLEMDLMQNQLLQMTRLEVPDEKEEFVRFNCSMWLHWAISSATTALELRVKYAKKIHEIQVIMETNKDLSEVTHVQLSGKEPHNKKRKISETTSKGSE